MNEPKPQYHDGGAATIVTGDAAELIPTLADGSVSLVVTSPPYPDRKADSQRSCGVERHVPAHGRGLV